MLLGTSVRFVFPTSENTLPMYQQMAAALPPGSFIERPMGPMTVDAQTRHLDDLATAARDAGLWALIVGDNHAIPPIFANCFSPVPTIARLSGVTGVMAIGAVLLAPFHHPLLLAEQLGTIAAFVDVPTLWTFAVGDRQGAFDAFGIPRAERGRRTEAIIATVRALLAGETVTADGDGWSVRNASISPLPRQPPRFLVAGAAAPVIDRAARLGDGWLTAQNATDDELRRQLDDYRSACSRTGATPWPVLRRDIHVAESDEEARRHIDPILAEGYRGVTLERLLVGSPTTVVQRLDAYRAMGFDNVLVRHISGDHERILSSIELIGRDVIPEIGRWSPSAPFA
jgi:alkanesulfonate monooxygenase SsuD/methylene tetrahydromethanopterin reductase-like flavin-dependent oxidoreductase (luciferase family)